MIKKFIPIEGNKVACSFYNNCCKCATEVVKMRETDEIIELINQDQKMLSESEMNNFKLEIESVIVFIIPSLVLGVVNLV